MTQEQHFAIVIRYFLLLTVLLLITGAWMFTLHTHWSVDGTTAYYTQKSFFGLLETVSPHLFGMSIIFFILTHFFAVIKHKYKISKYTLLLFIVMLTSNVVSFFISSTVFFSLLKLLSTLTLCILSLYLIIKLYKTL